MLRIMFCLLIAVSMWSCTTTVNNITTPKTNIDSVEVGTMTDVDGNVYKTIKIGSQTWMAENLKTTKFNDGTGISYITDTINWNVPPGSALSGNYNTIPEYCYYNNKYSNRYSYGVLYNFSVVNSGKQLGPAGWHVPSADEWATAFKTDSSAMLKVPHKGGWLSDNGSRVCYFEDIDVSNDCWCSDTYTDAYGRVYPTDIMFDNYDGQANYQYIYKGCSIRLVKD